MSAGSDLRRIQSKNQCGLSRDASYRETRKPCFFPLVGESTSQAKARREHRSEEKGLFMDGIELALGTPNPSMVTVKPA